MITRRIARPSCRRRIIQISALSTFDVKKLVVGLWVGSAGPPSGVHRFTRPFCRRCAPGLNWPGRASGAVTLKKLECSKQAYALLLTSYVEVSLHGQLLRGTMAFQATEIKIIAIVGLQRGIPSKRESSARVDYVPALCTHRPSLLPIEWSGEVLGSRRRVWAFALSLAPRRLMFVVAPFGVPWILIRHHNKTPARYVPRKTTNEKDASNFVPFAVCVLVVASLESQTTLATDISAHASMKNVAKCDTWCELQNPVNHRVFERKLRPKPSGRGHACLGVTHRVAPNHASLIGTHGIGAEIGLPCLWCGWPKLESPSVDRSD
ncbi:hypothetical protein L1887_53486 [Cichorium endivia]|nr:hypothetical protein L1887_53486 [Cichorium endivia]